jgi:hypothetical protein
MYKGDMVSKFESLMDMIRTFNFGDTFHDQLFRLHSPVEIIENDGNRSNFECLACQVIWPCHTYTILEAWARHLMHSAKPKYNLIKEAATDEPLTEGKMKELIEQASAKNTILPTVPEPMNKRRTVETQRPFGQHMFERSLFYPKSKYCNRCNLPRENAIHVQIEGAEKEQAVGKADNVPMHWWQPSKDGDPSCRICGLPEKNQRHYNMDKHSFIRGPGSPYCETCGRTYGGGMHL